MDSNDDKKKYPTTSSADHQLSSGDSGDSEESRSNRRAAEFRSETVPSKVCKISDTEANLPRRFTSADFYSMLSVPAEQSVIMRYLDNSSGSDDDIGPEARRIMNDRKKDRKRIEELGPLVPIDMDVDEPTASTTADQSESVVPHTTYESLRGAIPLRRKRADTQLIIPYDPERTGFRGTLTRSKTRLLDRVESNSESNRSATFSQKSSLASTVRASSQHSSVHFGVVEGREYDVCSSEGSSDELVSMMTDI
jgi:hypothetical protein